MHVKTERKFTLELNEEKAQELFSIMSKVKGSKFAKELCEGFKANKVADYTFTVNGELRVSVTPVLEAE